MNIKAPASLIVPLIVCSGCVTTGQHSTGASILSKQIGTNEWACYSPTGTLVKGSHSQNAVFEACTNAALANPGPVYEIRAASFELSATGGAAQVCGDSPAEGHRTQTCPAGTSGTWEQTHGYIEADYPVCWTASAWMPSSPQADECPPITAGDVCPESPPYTTRYVDCPDPKDGNWEQTLGYTLQPHPTCWVAGVWSPTSPQEGYCDDVPTACGAQPPGNERTQACPPQSTGTWSQSQVYLPIAAPECWALGSWTPSVPPEGRCVHETNDCPPQPEKWQTVNCATEAQGTWKQWMEYQAVDPSECWRELDWTPVTPQNGDCVDPQAPSGPAVTVSWTPPTAWHDGTPFPADEPITYEVYQWMEQQDAHDERIVVASGIKDTSVVIAFGIPKGKVCWYVQAVVNDTISDPSNEACKTF